MDTLLLVGLCVGGAVGLGVLIYRVAFSPRARGGRRLERTPHTPIAEAPMGEPIKIVGRVRFVGEPLRAPMSGRPCVCWHVRVQEARQGAQGGSWNVVIDEVEGQDFMLEDDTGIAVVRGVLPEATLVQSGSWSDNYTDDFPPEVEKFLEDRGEQTHWKLGKRVMRFEERTLDEGTQAAVLGVARGRDATRKTDLLLDSLDDGRLLVSNRPSALN